jgi:hypothetical protein
MDARNLGGVHRAPRPVVRLSCEMCRQRKTRCDRQAPCSSCLRLGVPCSPVERPRLPRGRHRPEANEGSTYVQSPILGSHSTREADLQSRVAQLERLGPAGGGVGRDQSSISGESGGVVEEIAPRRAHNQRDYRYDEQNWTDVETEVRDGSFSSSLSYRSLTATSDKTF